MIIEFYGLPGSGKSFLAAALRERLIAGGMDVALVTNDRLNGGARVAQLLKKLVIASCISITRPGLLKNAWAAVSSAGQGTLKEQVMLTIAWLLVARSYYAVPRRRRIRVLDQGVVQALWATALRRPCNCSAEVDVLARELLGRASVLVVSVEADSCEVLRRLGGRQSRNSRLETDEERSALLACASSAKMLTDRWLADWAFRKQHSFVRVWNSSGAGDSESAVDAIVAAVQLHAGLSLGQVTR